MRDSGILILRTDSSHPGFRQLVQLLDADLRERDGEDHAFFAQFNKIDLIRHVVVVLLNGEAIACGAFKPCEKDTAEIKRMYVRPAHRRKGNAARVLSELERWAVEEGFHRCILETGLQQPEAIALYKHKGYTQIPNYGPYDGVELSVCFEKKLD